MALLVAVMARDLSNILPLNLAITSPFLLGYLVVDLVRCRGGIGSGGVSLGSVVLTYGGASFSLFSSSSMYLLLPSPLGGFQFVGW